MGKFEFGFREIWQLHQAYGSLKPSLRQNNFWRNKMKEILDRIKERFKENKNWLALIIGETGSGKSWSAIKLGEQLDPNFSIDNICFTPKEFLERIDKGELAKGSILIYDEAGISFGARDFYQDVNKALSYVLQGFRAFNIGTIFTTPNLSFIDIHARKLIHTVLETISVNHNESYCIVKWKNLEHNPLYDKTYYKFPRIIRNNRIITVDRIKIYKASDKLLDAYEKKKMAYLKALTKRSIDSIDKDEAKKHPLTDEQLIDTGNKEGIDWSNTGKIMARFNIYREKVYRLQAKVRER